MKKLIATVGSGLLPVLAFAQIDPGSANAQSGGLGSVIAWVGRVLNALVPIFIAVAVVWFIYQVIKYVIASDEEGKGAARTQMIYGIIALFVIISVWGLVNVLQATFGVGTTTVTPPILPGI